MTVLWVLWPLIVACFMQYARPMRPFLSVAWCFFVFNVSGFYLLHTQTAMHEILILDDWSLVFHEISLLMLVSTMVCMMAYAESKHTGTCHTLFYFCLFVAMVMCNHWIIIWFLFHIFYMMHLYHARSYGNINSIRHTPHVQYVVFSVAMLIFCVITYQRTGTLRQNMLFTDPYMVFPVLLYMPLWPLHYGIYATWQYQPFVYQWINLVMPWLFLLANMPFYGINSVVTEYGMLWLGISSVIFFLLHWKKSSLSCFFGLHYVYSVLYWLCLSGQARMECVWWMVHYTFFFLILHKSVGSSQISKSLSRYLHHGAVFSFLSNVFYGFTHHGRILFEMDILSMIFFSLWIIICFFFCCRTLYSMRFSHIQAWYIVGFSIFHFVVYERLFQGM